MEKKGMGTGVAVTAILLLITAAVLLSWVFRGSVLTPSNADACHYSVAAHSAVKGAAGEINCRTDYVCISGGTRCANMNPTVTIKVDPTNDTQILKAIADQMAICWWEFGEGKLDYVGAFSAGKYCGVCSIVGFDNKVQAAHSLLDSGASCKYNYQCLSGNCDSKVHVCVGTTSSDLNNSIAYKKLFDFLASEKTKEGGTLQTYLSYLYGVYDIPLLFDTSSPVVKDFYDSKFIYLNSTYSIITGESNAAKFNIFPSKYLGVVFLKNSDIQTYLGNECEKFITSS